MVGRLLSFWDGIFSGAMLNFQGVSQKLPSSMMIVMVLVFSHYYWEGVQYVQAKLAGGLQNRFSLPGTPKGC